MIASFNIHASKQFIAFQPLDDYNQNELSNISKETGQFYGRKIIVLQPIVIPAKFLNPTINAYSAASIIALLGTLQNDTIAEIIGLTHKSIYTLKQVKNISWYDDRISGMGYWSGNACVISDTRLSTKDQAVSDHRMRNVIIHETGHNPV